MRRMMSASIMAIAAAGCGSRSDLADPEPPAAVRLATFDAGLASDTPYAEERAPRAAAALAALPLDALCVQQLWRPADADMVRAATAASLPNAITAPPEPGPAEADGGFRYDGSTGLVLLTRLPVLESGLLALESSLLRRAVLYARLDAPAGELAVFCTNLGGVRGMAYPWQGSQADEQRAQVEALLAFVDAKARALDSVIVLGNLETGPAVGDAEAVAPNVYARLLSAGLLSPFAAQPDAGCTYCAENPLVGPSSSRPPSLVDHVLVARPLGQTSAERILSDRIRVHVGGQEIGTAYSDHYGVMATLSP